MLEYRVGMQERICVVCDKPFAGRSRQKYCKDCTAEGNRLNKVKYRQTHKNEIRATINKWCRNNPDKKRAQHDRYYAKHGVEVRARDKSYYARNRDACRARNNEQSQTLPGRLNRMFNGARDRDPDRFCLERKHVKELLETTTHCIFCRCRLTFKSNRPNTASLDRIDPTKGYTPANIHIICKQCNTKKQNNTIHDFARFLYHMCKGKDDRIMEALEAVRMEKDVYPDA